MSQTESMRRRARLNRPSLRARARPPKLRTPVGADFSAANLPVALALQHCADCGRCQYPPREVCEHCLSPTLYWREAQTGGSLLAAVALHHSLWEFFKRRIASAPWPVATIRLDCDVTVFAHLALQTFAPGADGGATTLPGGTRVQVFSHSDCSRNAVLIAVAEATPIATAAQRRALAEALGLTTPALKPGGL
jgi:uncharacterized OB-fold protein